MERSEPTGYEHFQSIAALEAMVESMREHATDSYDEREIEMALREIDRRREGYPPSPVLPPTRIAYDRDEWDPCQRGTVGCCIDHDADEEQSCQTW